MEKHIVELVERYSNVDKIQMNRHLYTINLAELDVADIFMDVEEAFQVTIAEVDESILLNLTVAEFVRWICCNLL